MSSPPPPKHYIPPASSSLEFYEVRACSVMSQRFVTPWAVACQAPLFMGFSNQECWSGLPCPPPWDLPNPRNRTCIIYRSCIGRHILWINSKSLFRLSGGPVGKTYLYISISHTAPENKLPPLSSQSSWLRPTHEWPFSPQHLCPCESQSWNVLSFLLPIPQVLSHRNFPNLCFSPLASPPLLFAWAFLCQVTCTFCFHLFIQSPAAPVFKLLSRVLKWPHISEISLKNSPVISIGKSVVILYATFIHSLFFCPRGLGRLNT